jgi:anti-sigma-K factor RskA
VSSFRQIEANRGNALRSTGPKTEAGKRRSRRHAVRHGLTAETVVVALEDIEDYQAFEAGIIADYDARTAVERELVLRLASLLWRMRRANGSDAMRLRYGDRSCRRCLRSKRSDTDKSLLSQVGFWRASIPQRLVCGASALGCSGQCRNGRATVCTVSLIFLKKASFRRFQLRPAPVIAIG